MVHSSYIPALKFFIVLSILSNRTLSFYVISSSCGEPCKERVRIVRNIYPESMFVEYELAKSDNLKRFNEIVSIIDVVFLPSPLVCVFVDTDLSDYSGRTIGRGLDGYHREGHEGLFHLNENPFMIKLDFIRYLSAES